MATIVGGIATSHTPTIGFALDTNKQKDAVWAPIFEGYKPVQQWLADPRCAGSRLVLVTRGDDLAGAAVHGLADEAHLHERVGGDVGGPHPRAHLVAGEPGQHDVEHDDVVPAAFTADQRAQVEQLRRAPPELKEQQPGIEVVPEDLGHVPLGHGGHVQLRVQQPPDPLEGDQRLHHERHLHRKEDAEAPPHPHRFHDELRDAVFAADPLRRALQAHLRLRRPLAEINLSPADGKMLSEIHEYGEVLDQRTIGDRLVLRARIGEKLAGRLRRAGAIVEREDATKS